jgi:Tol biopolymer transport system component
MLPGYSMPAVSHDGTMMACEVRYYFGWGIVHYISIFEIPSMQYLYSIAFTYGPNSPSVSGVSGVAFSADDSRLFFSAIPPNETKREIYSIKLDGSDLKRLTTNVWDEFYPEGYK